MPASTDSKQSDVTTDDALVQFSLLAVLAAGDYMGGIPLRNVLAGGDFGVGTFGRLDGEMIVVDGKIFQALADGTVRAANLDGTTPFAAVKFFSEDGRIDHFAAATLRELDERLDHKLSRRNVPYAIRIDGEFRALTLRSVPGQSVPFQPLVDVVKQNQVTWHHEQMRGTLIGLRCPTWMAALNVAGYHWHFLSDDRTIGGHVLECEARDCLVRFDECASIVVHLPNSREFDQVDPSRVNENEIDQIERQRIQPMRP